MCKPAYEGHEFEALKTRYEDHVGLLRVLTQYDVRVFTGYITIQLLLGSWLSRSPLQSVLPKVGLFLIDFVLAAVAGKLLYNQYRRRAEVVATIRNINEALGFTREGVYIENKAINAPTQPRPWFPWLLAGIAVAFFGVCMILFGSYSPSA